MHGVGGVRSTKTKIATACFCKESLYYWAKFKLIFNRPCVFLISNGDYGFCVGQERGVEIKGGDSFFCCEACFALATFEATFNTRR